MRMRLVLAIAILVLAIIFVAINPKLNIKRLLIDAFNVYKDNKSGKLSIKDFLTFFISPIFVGIALSFGFEFCFTEGNADTLITLFSILFTILFGIMSLISASLSSENEIKKKVSKESFASITFSMVMSLVELCLLLIYICICRTISSVIVFQAFSAAIIALAICILLHFFMIIKRSYLSNI